MTHSIASKGSHVCTRWDDTKAQGYQTEQPFEQRIKIKKKNEKNVTNLTYPLDKNVGPYKI